MPNFVVTPAFRQWTGKFDGHSKELVLLENKILVSFLEAFFLQKENTLFVLTLKLPSRLKGIAK